MYWDLRASGLLTCCVVLGEYFYLSGLCAFSLSIGEDASLFHMKTEGVRLAYKQPGCAF